MSVAQNAAIWQYSERLRELDDRLVSPLFVQLLLECARASEKEDFAPTLEDPGTVFEYAALMGPLERWLREQVTT